MSEDDREKTPGHDAANQAVCARDHRSLFCLAKIDGGLQELDETGYWLELLLDAEIAKADQIEPLAAETNALLSIFVSVAKSVKRPARA